MSKRELKVKFTDKCITNEDGSQNTLHGTAAFLKCLNFKDLYDKADENYWINNAICKC